MTDQVVLGWILALYVMYAVCWLSDLRHPKARHYYVTLDGSVELEMDDGLYLMRPLELGTVKIRRWYFLKTEEAVHPKKVRQLEYALATLYNEREGYVPKELRTPGVVEAQDDL